MHFVCRFFILFLTVTAPFAVKAQLNCVSAGRIQGLREALAAGRDIQPNPALQKELKDLKSKHLKWFQETAFDRSRISGQTFLPKDSQKTIDKMCTILNEQPWPSTATVGAEGAANWIYLIKNYFPFDTQLKLMPVIAQAIKSKAVKKDNDLASFIDRIRLRVGLAQLFGTQAAPQDKFLVLAPLQSEQNVDKWRAEYGLPPLRDYLRSLELNYGTVLLKSVPKPASVKPTSNATDPDPMRSSDVVQTETPDDEILKVETSIVTLDATVYGLSQTSLKKTDFKLFEDGKPQEIIFFASVEAPFDIVLLLDLSGSTANQVDLIRKTTRKFIEVKRDADRISIVTFAYHPTVVSPLESTRSKLLESVSKIDDSGGSNVWDALKFSLDSLGKTSEAGRRKAVVIMTDGADNALMFRPNIGSQILFSEMLEAVKNAGVSVFPIYLDTEGPGQASERIYADARRTLKLLADESGGSYYAAKDVGDLSTVYERVMQDIGSVYSLGYTSTNDKHDGSWRTLQVEIPGKPDMKVRTRPGYYAK